MNVSIDFLKNELLGTTVPIPLSGTLSGHAAGEPFDKHVFAVLKKHFIGITFRQYEFLNNLYETSPEATTATKRLALIKDPAVAFLLNRGKATTEAWRPDAQFEEKQNDTADILIVKDGFYNIIDVKTFNKAKGGQPPNIISAYKLAKMAWLMLKNDKDHTHDITYVGITWEKDGQTLKCVSVDIKELFKTNPQKLYINWAAALQIQFHTSSLIQDYVGSVTQWCKEYIVTFTSQAEKRLLKMRKLFIDPFID